MLRRLGLFLLLLLLGRGGDVAICAAAARKRREKQKPSLAGALTRPAPRLSLSDREMAGAPRTLGRRLGAEVTPVDPEAGAAH